MLMRLAILSLGAFWAALASFGSNASVMYSMNIDGPGASADFSLSGLTLDYPDDPYDWYSWIAPADGTVFVDIFFSDALMDIDLELRDMSLAVLDGSYSVTDNESVNAAVTGGIEYLIAVSNFTEFGENDAYVPDPYEPNNQAQLAARLVNQTVPVPSTLALLGLGLLGLRLRRR